MAPMTVIETITITRPLKVSTRISGSRENSGANLLSCGRWPGNRVPVRHAGAGLARHVPSVDRLAHGPGLAPRIVPPLRRRGGRATATLRLGSQSWMLPRPGQM